MVFHMMKKSRNASGGMTPTKIQARLPPMTNAMITEKIIIIGLLTATRMIIMNAICTLVMSVVIRVTSEGVENLSMFSKEKSCTL